MKGSKGMYWDLKGCLGTCRDLYRDMYERIYRDLMGI